MVPLVPQFGPLFIHPLFYFGSKLIYRREFEHSQMQKYAHAVAVSFQRADPRG